MWKKFFLSDLGDLYALVHCTLLDHPLALRPYVILQFPLQIILRPPPPMRADVRYWQPPTKNRNGNGFGNLISHLMISPSCVVTWPRRMPVKWLSSSWDERTFPTLNISFLTLKYETIEEEKSWLSILGFYLNMRRRKPFLQDTTAFSEKMIVAALLFNEKIVSCIWRCRPFGGYRV